MSKSNDLSFPSSKNFCGGAFPDWLEVNLTDKCNGKCSWCVEKDGWHPKKIAEWWVMAEQALKHGALNIILLGGEPTLYENIAQLIKVLSAAGRMVWITTNGSLLTPEYVADRLVGLFGINISIHHYDLMKNQEITGLMINEEILKKAITVLHRRAVPVRMNCNCIRGYIDTVEEITHYICFAKNIGACKVRFAELKQDDDGFVDLAKTLNYKYGLNDNPFLHGCNSDAVIEGMPVNFRQMCGLQTTRRVKPKNPQGVMKKVLYYDGKFYDGWQTIKKEEPMKYKDLVKLLQDVADGKISVAKASLKFGEDQGEEKIVGERSTFDKNMQEIVKDLNEEFFPGAGYCQY